jgi:hypothetical protein
MVVDLQPPHTRTQRITDHNKAKRQANIATVVGANTKLGLKARTHSEAAVFFQPPPTVPKLRR